MAEFNNYLPASCRSLTLAETSPCARRSPPIMFQVPIIYSVRVGDSLPLEHSVGSAETRLRQRARSN